MQFFEKSCCNGLIVATLYTYVSSVIAAMLLCSLMQWEGHTLGF